MEANQGRTWIVSLSTPGFTIKGNLSHGHTWWAERVYSALTWDVWIHLLLNPQLMGLVLVLRVLHSLGNEQVKE